MEHKVRILAILHDTHETMRLIVQKPENYQFLPGQSTFISLIEKSEYRRPYSFAASNYSPNLEFYIKSYEDHYGLSSKIDKLSPGDEILISEPFGTLNYKGPGYFIAGGAGITPFLSILRQLEEEALLTGNELYYANKTAGDIIAEKELRAMLGKDCTFTLSREKRLGYEMKLIDKNYLETRTNCLKKYFYLCGPQKMILNVAESLLQLGVQPEKIIYERHLMESERVAA